MVKREFIDSAHGQIHLRKAGELSSKPTIICLHMVPKSGRSFASLMPELSKDRLVLAPDYPGYGESSALSYERPPEISDYADSVEHLVKHFALEQVVLIGYHTGSMVAAELAHRLGDQVKKVIMLSAPIFTEKELAEIGKFYQPVALDKQGTRYKLMWERVLHFNDPRLPLEKAAESFAENLRAGEDYELGHAAAFAYSREYVNFLQRLEQPLWVMNLNDDLHEQTKRADPHIKNGRRSDFPDWTHGCFELFPNEVAQTMLRFIDA